MANEVYTQALGAMQRLVSARAASRALDSALKARGETPDTVDAEVMSRVLLGPILSEFETILPREGLKRQLRSLAANLRKNFPKPLLIEPESANLDADVNADVDADTDADADIYSEEEMRQVVANEASTPSAHETEPGFVYQTNALNGVPESLDLIFSVTSSSVRTPSAPQGVAAAPQPAAQPAEEARNVVSAALESGDLLEIPEELLELPDSFEPELETPGTSAPETPTETPTPPLSGAQLEAAVLRFAQLEQVKFVAALRPNGEVAAQRGSGIDVAALAQLGLVGLRLLRRSGPLRTYYLAHTRGQLFLLPFGEDTLTLVGTPELNVGAIFNTFTSLKEEL